MTNIKNNQLCKGETLNTQLAAGLFILVKAHEDLYRVRTLAEIAGQEQITEETIKKFIRNNIMPYKMVDVLPRDFQDRRRPGFTLADLFAKD
jgi:hypothetical protein